MLLCQDVISYFISDTERQHMCALISQRTTEWLSYMFTIVYGHIYLSRTFGVNKPTGEKT